MHGKPLPPSVKGTQRVTGMTSGQKQFLTNAPIRPFQQHGKCGRWMGDLLPHTAKIVDDIAVLKAVNTEAINHDPGITFINTGNQQIGHPSLGAWLSYGLGSENANLPGYMVLISQGTGKNPGQPIFARLWGSGYSAKQASRRAVAARMREPGAVSFEPCGHRPQDAARATRRLGRTQRASRQRDRRPGN